jgi:hypothetical protein
VLKVVSIEIASVFDDLAGQLDDGGSVAAPPPRLSPARSSSSSLQGACWWSIVDREPNWALLAPPETTTRHGPQTDRRRPGLGRWRPTQTTTCAFCVWSEGPCG